MKPSTSRMASPLVIVTKKDGSLRLACNYRYINSFTIEWQYCNVRAIRYKRILFFMDCRDAYRYVRCGFVYVNVCYGAAFMYAAAQLCGRAYVVPRTRAAALS